MRWGGGLRGMSAQNLAHAVAGNPPETQTSNRVYFPALDGLRAVAFLVVFLLHYLGLTFGWVGVDCFFALSGFLITGLLFDTMDDPHRVRNFYVRRTLRIFPLYYGVFLLLLVSTPVMHWQWSARWWLWPAYLGNWLTVFHRGPVDPATQYVINGALLRPHAPPFLLGHFWSLCVEEQFYLVWPFAVFLVRGRRALLCICAAIIVICPVLRWLAFEFLSANRLGSGVVPHNTVFRVDTLMFGAAAALLYRGPNRERLLAAARPLGWVAGLLALVFFVHPPARLLSVRGWEVMETVGFSVIALLSTAVILRTLTPASRFFKIFSLRPLRWIGRVSYGAYVFHDVPRLRYEYLARHNLWLTAGIGLVCTLVLAGLSYRFFESPFLRLKDRLAPAETRKGTGAAKADQQLQPSNRFAA